MLLMSSADIFQNQFSQKILSGTLPECQMVWIQIRTDRMLVLIWVQTACIGYQQRMKFVASTGRVNISITADRSNLLRATVQPIFGATILSSI